MKIGQYLLVILLSSTSILLAQERRIKPGDGIEIVVYGHQELSRVVTVSPQGAIDFPFMQNLPVDGLTLEKLREIVVAQLSRYLDTFPVVTLNFSRSTVININIMGMVSRPGIVQMPLSSNLQAAIASAGGFLPGAKVTEILLMRSDNGKTINSKYDLEKFLGEGDLQQNPVLTEGDAILITGTQQLDNVKVLGEVRQPGAFDQFTGATVVDMLMRSGGPTKDADVNKIRFISPTRKKGNEYIINLNEYLKSTTSYPMPVVKPGDIIYVPKKIRIMPTVIGLARDLSSIAIAVWYIARLNN